MPFYAGTLVGAPLVPPAFESRLYSCPLLHRSQSAFNFSETQTYLVIFSRANVITTWALAKLRLNTVKYSFFIQLLSTALMKELLELHSIYSYNELRFLLIVLFTYFKTCTCAGLFSILIYAPMILLVCCMQLL